MSLCRPQKVAEEKIALNFQYKIETHGLNELNSVGNLKISVMFSVK